MHRRCEALLFGLTLSLLEVAPAAALRGDASCDGVVDQRDVEALLGDVFAAADCADGDVNADGRLGSADLVALVAELAAGRDPDPSPTAAPEASGTPTAEPTSTRASAATPTALPGPRVLFFGLAAADGRPISAQGSRDGIEVYERPIGRGFRLVVEAMTGASGRAVGTKVFVGGGRPDLQIESTLPLGNGSAAVCESGVPAIDPPDFGPGAAVDGVLNDLGCRFGVATSRAAACTLDSLLNHAFIAAETRVQFCAVLDAALELPRGEALLTVQVADSTGAVGERRKVIVRVGSPLPTPTITPSPPPTAVPTTTSLPTHTVLAPTATETVNGGRTGTPTPTGTRTRTGTRTSTGTRTLTVAPTRSNTRTPSATRSAIPTRTPTSTRSVTRTRTATGTATATRTRTFTGTATPTGGPGGPSVTFFGVANADGRRSQPIATATGGVPIYLREHGAGFLLVVEGRRNGTVNVGQTTFTHDPGNADVRPALQILSSRALGNGSSTVCDNAPPDFGGVPAVSPPSFEVTQGISDAINDFGCRFIDGKGARVGRAGADACVLFPSGEYGFVNSQSQIQFCATVSQAMRFPFGDTLLTVRLANLSGATGPPAQIIVRTAVEDSP